MKLNTLIVLAAVLLISLTMLTSCGGDAAPNPAELPDKVISSTDGNSQVTVPKDWDEMDDLNDEADLQAGSESDDVYLIVLTESREDFVDFNAFTELASSSLAGNVESPEVNGPTDETINGRPAKVYQINGTRSGVKIAYLYTTVDGPSFFHQVVMFTTQSKFADWEPTLRQVLATFEEIAK